MFVLHSQSAGVHRTLHTHQVNGHPQCQCFTVSTNSAKHSTHTRWSSNKHFTHIRWSSNKHSTHTRWSSNKHFTHITSLVNHNVSALQSECRSPSNTPHTSDQWSPTMAMIHSWSAGVHQTLHTHQVNGHPQCQCFTVRAQESIKHFTHFGSVVTYKASASQCTEFINLHIRSVHGCPQCHCFTVRVHRVHHMHHTQRVSGHPQCHCFTVR